MSNNEETPTLVISDDSGAFKPPASFVQASLARQAKIKQQQRERSRSRSPAPPNRTTITSSSTTISIQSVSSTPSKPAPCSKPPPCSTPSKPPPSSTPSKATSSQTRPTPSSIGRKSKTVEQISLLEKRRQARRAQQQEAKKEKESLDVAERDIITFKEKIEAWRKEWLKRTESQSSDPTTPSSQNTRIKVCIRKRPLPSPDTTKKQSFDTITLKTSPTPSQIHLHEPKTRFDLSKDIETHTFTFDTTFSDECTNETVYTHTAQPLVSEMFTGGRGTVFAYGQTGSGKTHTVFGSGDEMGIYGYACRDVFSYLESEPFKNKGLSLQVCFFEIYGGKVYDLLCQKNRVQLLEDHQGIIRVLGLKEITVTSLPQLLQLGKEGMQTRTTGTTESNPDSSRSHAVFQFRLRSSSSEPTKLIGKFSLVDLAGSERATDRGTTSRLHHFEGAEINKSLLALKECIRALHKGGGHIPFRASKLTQILRDSFMGRKSRTVMIGTVCSGVESVEHSLNTVRYADRVKELKRGRERERVVKVIGDGGQEDDDEQDDEEGGDDGDQENIFSEEEDSQSEEWLDSIPPSPSPTDTLTPFLTHHIRTLHASKSLMEHDRDLIHSALNGDSSLDSYIDSVLESMTQREKVWGELRALFQEWRGSRRV